MNIKNLDHMNLTVEDFDATVDWYGRIFNFRLVEEDVTDGVRWGVLRSQGGEGGTMLCIYHYPGFRFWDRHTRKGKKVHGINHWGFRIEDPAEWEKLLEREGEDSYTWDYPHSKSWYVTDPTGYEMEVSYWKNGVNFESAKISHA